MEQIKTQLNRLVYSPYNDSINFELGYLYENEKQYAAAVSYYLRSAEFTEDNVFASESLLRASLCINNQEGRDEKELYLIKHAINESPNSLEPYYIASLYFSWRKKWMDSYHYANLGINILENKIQEKSFNKTLNYDDYQLYYQKAFSGTHIGKINEAREIYSRLMHDSQVTQESKNFINSKLCELPEPCHPIQQYCNEKISTLKYNFNNCDSINKNYSQIYQDMFVLSIHNGKTSGTYLEIGAGDYKNGNNTYLLESRFNWTGISVDINRSFVDNFNNNRTNNCICEDATKIDYHKLLDDNLNLELSNDDDKSKIIDYLQLDCDPPNITFDILKKIPFDSFKFGVITYEHDFYNDHTGSYREKSRDFLKSKGYKLLCGNISPYKDKYPFEDWWFHPGLIDRNIYRIFEREDDEPINGEKYMLTKNKINNTKKIDYPISEYPVINSKIKLLYDFIPCHDQLGNDLCRYNPTNLEKLLESAYNVPGCIAVNTHGYLKNNIDKIQQINYWYYPKDGIYIKKTNKLDRDRYKNMIPVFGTLVCTTCKWIIKQLDTIDYPIENYIIINNNYTLSKELETIVSKKHKFIKNLKVYTMPYNLGCAEGWNMIIKSFMFSPYWIISNDDVAFTPGFLDEMNTKAYNNINVGLIHGNPINLPYLNKFGAFDLFLIKDWVIQEYGLFDINYYPAYFEDFDYIMRLIDKPIDVINSLDHSYYHGDTFDYNKTGANTKNFNDLLNIKLTFSKYENLEYFVKKWNIYPEHINGENIKNCYKTPFNKNSSCKCTFDLEFCRSKHLLNSLWQNNNITTIDNINTNLNTHITNKYNANVIVIDNFYTNPDKIREYALSLTYQSPENHGAVGYRSESGRKILEGTKEFFEKLLHKSIPNGNNHGEWNYSTNGCFQWCNARVPIVYHADSQQYAAILYLTPDAPPNCGTSFFRHKNYKIRNSEIFSKPDWHKSSLIYRELNLDKTLWEIVDSIGNVYNRLVIFDAQYIHAVTEYFGEDINNSRLFQLFFFNVN